MLDSQSQRPCQRTIVFFLVTRKKHYTISFMLGNPSRNVSQIIYSSIKITFCTTSSHRDRESRLFHNDILRLRAHLAA